MVVGRAEKTGQLSEECEGVMLRGRLREHLAHKAKDRLGHAVHMSCMISLPCPSASRLIEKRSNRSLPRMVGPRPP